MPSITKFYPRVYKSRYNRSTGQRSTVSVRSRKSKISRGMLSTHYHKFIRSCTFGQSYVVGVDTRTGFSINGVSSGVFNMQFAFKLEGVNVFVNGVSSTTLALPNYTEFTALYDQYRLDWIECNFIFTNNTSSVNSPGTVLPVMYLAKDYDDTNVANYTDLQQYSTQTTWQLGMQHGSDGKKTIRIKPNVDVALYQGVTTGYARGKPMMIDTSSPSVPHYGIKIAYDPVFTPAAATNVGYLTCNFIYHMTMAHTK